MVQLAQPQEGERVLDVACGTGALTRVLSASVGPTGSVVGLDVNPQMLALAATKVSGSHVEWREGSALDLPFDESAFDLVTCQQGLQFFPDRSRALAEMRRVVRDGGRLAVSCWRSSKEAPAHAALERSMSRRVGPEAAALPPFSLWDADELRRLVEAAGFRNVQISVLSISVPYPSAEFFVRSSAAAAPYRGGLRDQGEAVLAEIVTEVGEALFEYTGPDGSISFPQVTHLLLAAA
jgi:ubiquinone/menaquinone biosynthesis C-methylase UbiE